METATKHVHDKTDQNIISVAKRRIKQMITL